MLMIYLRRMSNDSRGIPVEFPRWEFGKQKSLLGVRIDLSPPVASYQTLKKWGKKTVKQTQLH